MKSIVSILARTMPLILLLVVSSACGKETGLLPLPRLTPAGTELSPRLTPAGIELNPTRAMSSEKISGAAELKELLDARESGLVGTPAAQPALPGRKPGAPVVLSLEEAVLTGLAHNESFRVERLQPAISRSTEEVERAAFDPLFTASASHGQQGRGSTLRDTTIATGGGGDAESTQAALGLRQATTIGATVELTADREKLSLEELAAESEQQSWDLTVTQALLRGRGPSVTLARLRQTRLDTEISLYELQGAAETLVTQIEKGYWDLILAERSLAIYQQSLTIAEDQVAEVKERIRVGALAENEAAAAEAEAASRYQQLVAARGTLAKARLNLLRFVNPEGRADWQAELKPTEEPELKDMAVDAVENHVALALNQRADLNQARLLVRRRDLEVVKTKNGLLPKLDLFISLGGSRFADSFAGEGEEVDHQQAYAGGLTLELPLGNREAKALHAAAGWSLGQAAAALANMEQLVQVDVRSAHVDVEQAAAMVKAAEATLVLREKTYALEQEKFRLGRSTTLLVAQAQRDLVASRIALAEAVVGVRKAFIDLYRLEGSLLAHRGIGA